MRLTESVRSFHVPGDALAPRAWPPSSPSVPTSRATRVTSEANDESWSTIVLTVFFSSSISPATSTVTLRDRSPLATAVVTSAMSRTWAVSRYAMVLTESVRSFHEPDIPRTWAWPPSLPSVPTSRATRVTSSVNERQLVDQVVDGAADVQELTAQRRGPSVCAAPSAATDRPRRPPRAPAPPRRPAVPGRRPARWRRRSRPPRSPARPPGPAAR